MFIRLLSAFKIESFSKSMAFYWKGPIKYASQNSQQCKDRPTIVNINSNETFFYQFTVSVNKCGGSCNTIDDPYTWVFVSNKSKKYELKSINLMSLVNETRFLVQHESWECKCELNENMSNSKQKWNHNQCRCECKGGIEVLANLIILGILVHVIASVIKLFMPKTCNWQISIRMWDETFNTTENSLDDKN